MSNRTSQLLAGHLPTAMMITPQVPLDAAPILRKSFELLDGHGVVRDARLAATALGLCEATVNGRPASPDLLVPGWSSYEWRLRFSEWDVTELLKPKNVLGLTLGHGWHNGRLGFSEQRAVYGNERAGLAELRITYQDGYEQVIATDLDWEAGPSAICADDLYDGQHIDARLRDDSWLTPGPAPAGWTAVKEVQQFDRNRLVPFLAPPVRRQETVRIQSVTGSPSGATLLDFGQNLVGWLRVKVKGTEGESIVVRHAEVLENGELGVRPLRTAKQTDTFTLSGHEDVFEPTFTYHGFRYAEITGWPGTDAELVQNVEAVVISSDLVRTGRFECSDPLLNQLHSNVVWGMRGNFVGVPTDCPQRDERLGWTGDLSAFAPTATFLYDSEEFLRDWLLDLSAEQLNGDGTIPVVIPNNLKYEDLARFIPDSSENSTAEADDAISAQEKPEPTPTALWNDAAVWVPWAVWEASGNPEVLEVQYPSIASYVRTIARTTPEGVVSYGYQLGDWLDPTAPPEDPSRSKASSYVVATACLYRSVTLAARIANILGHDDDEAEFAEQADRMRKAFNRKFVSEGHIESDAETVYALAICFGLLEADEQGRAGDRLAQLVVHSGYRISTGFAGTPFILHALSKTGHLDTAYQLLLQQECPSWLYPVTMGATTVWERWDSMLPDGSINPGEMTSFNHYAFGAVADWMHKVIGGLAPLDAGYRRFLVAPRPGGGLTWAKTSLDRPEGQIRIQWESRDKELILNLVVPEGLEAVVTLDGLPTQTLRSGAHEILAPIASSRPLVS